MKRKTIEVERVLEICNTMLSAPKIDNDSKSHICTIIEIVLCETGNYNGFNYQNDECLEYERTYHSK